MHIICPHCTTSYAIDPATLGATGRTVRCSRCKEVWLARPEHAAEARAPVAVMAEAAAGGATTEAAQAVVVARQDSHDQETPDIDSPSISSDWPAEGQAALEAAETGLPAAIRSRPVKAARPPRAPWFGRRAKSPPSRARKPLASLPMLCAAMGALVLALVIWRIEVVRLLPQTAAFYKLVGLDVNLRGLAFRDMKITSETVDGKPVLVIEGMITADVPKPVEVPRLRFSVRDAQGAEIYAWNAILEQAVLKPGEKAWFKSRLASPPPEGRAIDVRFFNKRDIAGNI